MRRPLLGSLTALALLTACSDASDALGVLRPLLRASATDVEAQPTFVGYARTSVVELFNDGDAVTTFSGTTFEGDFALGEGAPDGVAPRSSARLPIVFRPAGPGPHTGSLTLTSNALDHPRIVVALRGEGLVTPSCGDTNACTDETFDPDVGRCITTFNASPCDDGDPCTSPDVCEGGGCSGRLFTCDDDNPCTTDACDAGGGCTHEDLADGTACGPLTQCVRANICVFGECEEHDVPEGFPCQDADPCTIDETCQESRCVPGSRVVSEPQVTGFARMFGSYVEAATALPDGRIVLLDHTSDGPTLRTVFRIGDQLTLGRTMPFSGGGEQGPLGLYPVGDKQVLVDMRTTAYVVDVDTQTLTHVLTLPSPPSYVAVMNTTVLECDGWSVRAFDLRGTRPVLQWDLPFPIERRGCSSIATDAMRSRVYVAEADGIRVLDVSTATVPRTARVLPPPSAERQWRRVVASDRALVVLDATHVAHVYDPDTLELASTLAIDCSIVANNVSHSCFAELHGATLIHARRDARHNAVLIATDLSRSTTPTTIAEEQTDVPTDWATAGAGMVFMPLAHGYLIAPGTRDPIRRLAGPEYGRPIGFLAPRTIVSRGSVHELDTSNPRRPTLSGGVRVPGFGQLFRSATRRYAGTLGTTTAAIVDLMVPSAPRVVGEATNYPGLGCVAASGRKMIGTVSPADALGVYDLSALTPGPMRPVGALPQGVNISWHWNWGSTTCDWNEATGDVLLRDASNALVHVDVRTSSSPRMGTFVLPPAGDQSTAVHPRGRGFVVTSRNQTGGCDVVTVERDVTGQLQVVSREWFDASCWNSQSLFVGALYLTAVHDDEITAVIPGMGSSYVHRFAGPRDMTGIYQAEDSLVFTTSDGVGMMTPACAP